MVSSINEVLGRDEREKRQNTEIKRRREKEKKEREDIKILKLCYACAMLSSIKRKKVCYRDKERDREIVR